MVLFGSRSTEGGLASARSLSTFVRQTAGPFGIGLSNSMPYESGTFTPQQSMMRID
jgi:hypothetical protein